MSGYRSDSGSLANNAKYLALLLIFYGLVLGGTYLLTEEIVVRKIVLALAMPVGFCWISLVTITYFLIVNNRKWFGLICLLLSLTLSIAGSPYLTRGLADSLEERFVGFRVDEAPEYDILVLLGGATEYNRNLETQLNVHGDRVLVAFQMYLKGKCQRIICTGSVIRSLAKPGDPSPGEQSRDLLVRIGVPAEQVELLDGRNTSEEIKNLAAKYGKSGLKIGIVSSAWHLPRVMRLAQRYHLKADPIPSNFISGETRFNVTALIPAAAPLAANTVLIKELLAKSVGQ